MQLQQSISVVEPDPIEQITLALQRELVGIFQISTADARSNGRIIKFSGRLIVNPDSSYEEVRRRFRPHGYTPVMKREKGRDVILAMEGLADTAKTGNPLINILLLLATIFTTLSFGSQLVLGISLIEAIGSNNIYLIGQAVIAGLPYALTLLGILGIHELGHYVAARLHGIHATLPYFIPLPFGLGTLGALIHIKSPMTNRKVLFDIGLAGPYAGLMVAVPLFMIGLYLSSTEYVPLSFNSGTLDALGSSLFIRGVVDVLTDIPEGYTLRVHPILFAAWWGIFVTGINLLPVGQLDGGHASYALFGRFAHGIALVTFLLLILAGSLAAARDSRDLSWFIWAFFIMLGGLRHPPPLNDISEVGPTRIAIGVLTIIVFILIFVPFPNLGG